MCTTRASLLLTQGWACKMVQERLGHNTCCCQICVTDADGYSSRPPGLLEDFCGLRCSQGRRLRRRRFTLDGSDAANTLPERRRRPAPWGAGAPFVYSDNCHVSH